MTLLLLGSFILPPAAWAGPWSRDPLSISGVTVHATGARQVRIEWDTDVEATTRVDGAAIGTVYETLYNSDHLVSHHAADLADLEAKRVYRFKVISKTAEEEEFIDGYVFASPGDDLSNPDWQWVGSDAWWGDPDQVGKDWAAQVYIRRADSEFERATHDPDTGNSAQVIRLATAGEADAVWQAVTLSNGFPRDYMIRGRVRLGPIVGGGEMKGFVAYSLSGSWDFNDVPQTTFEVIDETAITDPLQGSDWQPFVVTFTTDTLAGTIFLGGRRIGGGGPGQVIFDELIFGRLTPSPEYFIYPWTQDAWHMVSLPLAPESLDWPTVFNWGFSPPLPHDLNHALYRYDPALETYVAFDDSSPEEFGPARCGIGTWWYPMADPSLLYPGRVPNFDVRIELTPGANGWSLIGHPFSYAVPLERCRVYNPSEPDLYGLGVTFAEAVAAHWICPPLYRWSSSYQSYVTVNLPGAPDATDTDLDPWCGYWVRSVEPDLVLIVPWYWEMPAWWG